MKNLDKLTKKALEALGREKGVELDRRKSKKDLVKSLHDLKEEFIEDSPAPVKSEGKFKAISSYKNVNLQVFGDVYTENEEVVEYKEGASVPEGSKLTKLPYTDIFVAIK